MNEDLMLKMFYLYLIKNDLINKCLQCLMWFIYI